jgi:hypothetical protein
MVDMVISLDKVPVEGEKSSVNKNSDDESTVDDELSKESALH